MQAERRYIDKVLLGIVSGLPMDMAKASYAHSRMHGCGVLYSLWGAALLWVYEWRKGRG